MTGLLEYIAFGLTLFTETRQNVCKVGTSSKLFFSPFDFEQVVWRDFTRVGLFLFLFIQFAWPETRETTDRDEGGQIKFALALLETWSRTCQLSLTQAPFKLRNVLDVGIAMLTYSFPEFYFSPV